MKSLRLLGLSLLLLVGLGSGLGAQTLAPGTWTGTVTDPGGDEAAVTYAVTVTGDTLHIDMTIPEGPVTFTFNNIRFEGGKLLFTWNANIDINCSLDPSADGSYSGTCTDTEGASGQLRMIPPAG